jgi:hypothetical protein
VFKNNQPVFQGKNVFKIKERVVMKRLIKFSVLAMAAIFLLSGSVMADTMTMIGTERPSDDIPYYPGKNVSLQAILDRLYGAGNVERVSDASDSFFASTPTNTLLGMRAVAKYANYGHQVGFSVDSNGDGNYTNDITLMFDLPNNDYLAGRLTSNFESTASAFTSFNLTGDSKMALFLDPYNSGSGDVSTINAPMWSSDSSLNSDSRDHMVTYRITGNTGGYTDNGIGNYIVAWEDNWAYNPVRTSDFDFNDVVLEIKDPKSVGGDAPEPATMLLLGFGLAGMVVLRKKFRK